MVSKKQNQSVDPVIIVMLGVVFVAVAVAISVYSPNSNSINIAADAGVMSQLVVAFVTGITTGGLSCLAVQGGLLASSLAHQIEQDYTEQMTAARGNARGKKSKQVIARTNSALPIFLFLVAKIIAYTLLGALLGWLGDDSPGARPAIPGWPAPARWHRR